MTGGERRVRFDPADERMARLVWSRITEPGDRAASALRAERGPVAALRAVLEERPGTARWQIRLPDVDPERDLTRLARLGGRFVIPGDEEWPGPLDDLGDEAPPGLWVRGPLNLARACERAAAVVGARASTTYGEDIARDIGAGCVERGVTVVSGAAYGIDGAAHRGALAGMGPTVAVLACGVDRAYPRGHDRLIGRIASEGALMSEVPLGAAPTRWRFLERNRLIAGLSRVAVVVEASHRSGALGTAFRALKLGRTVAAVPGPVTSVQSAGCHRLLRDGAVCVTRAVEVVELATPMGECLPDEPAVPVAEYDGLTPVDLRLLDALPRGRPLDLPALSWAAGLEPHIVEAGLGRLEARRLACRDANRWRRAPPAK